MTLLIKKEGIFTSLQHCGRYGLQKFGVNPGGAMDRTAARLLNVLLGNDECDNVLELHFPAGKIAVEQETVFAMGGADFAAKLNGKNIEPWRSYVAEDAGDLEFPKHLGGQRCYLSIAGAMRTAGVPTYGTQKLSSNTQIEKARPASPIAAGQRISSSLVPRYSTFPTVRFVAGGEFETLSSDSRKSFLDEGFEIQNDSNRMGYRLRGPRLESNISGEMTSAAVSFGTIQLLPDGQLIVLMADHQTSGGYPRLGSVISADLPLLAQLGPGNKAAFYLVDIAEAEQVAEQFERDIARLKTGLSFGRYW